MKELDKTERSKKKAISEKKKAERNTKRLELKIQSTKNRLVEAMETTLGVVTTACKLAGVGRTQFYEYYNTDSNFAKACDEAQDVALDFAESQLHKQIKGGNASSTIFYLKTKGKKRGYIEKQEIDHTHEGNISHLPSQITFGKKD